MRRSRPFNVVDAMILVAAAALAFALVRAAEGVLEREVEGPLSETLERINRVRYECLVPATLGLLLIRLRQPRAASRRLARQPGFVATGSVALIVMIDLADFPWIAGQEFLTGDIGGAILIFIAMRQDHPGLGVAGAWWALAISGRWRAEPGWIDRSGIAVGVIWIGLGLVFSLIRLALGIHL